MCEAGKKWQRNCRPAKHQAYYGLERKVCERELVRPKTCREMDGKRQGAGWLGGEEQQGGRARGGMETQWAPTGRRPGAERAGTGGELGKSAAARAGTGVG